MKVSRRKFLAATPLAIGAVLPAKGLALVNSLSLPGGKTGDGDLLARLGWDSFYPYVTTNFAFSDAEGNAVDLLLTRMEDAYPRGYKPRGDGDECFSLIFSGRLSRPLTQDVYSVEHFALGSFRLFVTVLGTKDGRDHYEAVINRIRG